ncbi:MAG TPA: ferrous iron transport protein B [Polyangiales bacterium]
MTTPLVALAGNPNTGKTSVFNRLTGATARVGNYSGVTVERESGRWQLPSGEVEVVDIPGAYSLTARSHEEQLAMRAIFGLDGPRPNLVVVVIDATQLVRNLYLVTQLLEAGHSVVVAANMMDAARAAGRAPNLARVHAALGVPVVALSARTGEGFDTLCAAVGRVLAEPELGRNPLHFDYPAALEADVAQLSPLLQAADANEARALALWALLSVAQDDELTHIDAAVRSEVAKLRKQAEAAGRDLDAEIIATRWRWLDGLALTPPTAAHAVTVTERIDRFVLHPWLGTTLFVLVMSLLFEALFSWSEPAIRGTEMLFDWLGQLVRGSLPPSVFTDLVVDGVIGGVGSVLVFLPQILLLFFLLGFLEDSGYMARVAFLVDRGMRSIGLHGRAFVPMLSGFACAVPAIMATRTLERRRDRLVTMLSLPLMSCSARLPVYTLVAAAMLPRDRLVLGLLPVQTAAMIFMYLFSTVCALTAAAVIGRTVLKGPRIPLLLEVPPYRLPRLPVVGRQMWLRARSFLSEAGRVILACTIVLWALLYFPRGPELAKSYAARIAAAPAEQAATLRAELASERLRSSYGARLGKGIEPLIAPLGFDWKTGVGLVGAFAAREVFISTLGVVYGIGQADQENGTLLRDKIRAERRPDGKPRYTPLVGISLMIFFALSAQCMSTLAVVRRESGSLRWPLFLFAYMTTLAWLASFTVYQVGQALGFG